MKNGGRNFKEILKNFEMGSWFDFKGGRLKIRAVGLSEIPTQKAPLIAADPQAVKEHMDRETMKRVFFLALQQWENVFDVDRKPLELTDRVKEVLFDLPDIRDFVIERSIFISGRIFFDLISAIERKVKNE